MKSMVFKQINVNEKKLFNQQNMNSIFFILYKKNLASIVKGDSNLL